MTYWKGTYSDGELRFLNWKTLNREPETQNILLPNPTHWALSPEPWTPNPDLCTLDPGPWTLDPGPSTLNPQVWRVWGMS